MKKILITGGLGFLAFHLIKSLLKRYNNPRITVIDNLSSSIIEFGDLYSKLNVIINDFQKINVLNDSFDDIYHLASPVGSLGILKKNGYVAKEILELTYKAIEFSIKYDAKLIFISSSEIYGYSGMHEENAVKKYSNSHGTRMEYALGKYTSEIILRNLSFSSKLKYNIIRPFNIIGEQQSSKIGFVVPTFFENAIRNSPIPVYNDGKQKRSFCCADDIVSAIIAIQESDITGEIFNVGNNNSAISINDLAKKIRSICYSDSEIIHIDPVKIHGETYIEAFDKIPNLNKLESQIDWKPEIDLDTALNRLYNSYIDKDENIVRKSGVQG
jgi:UDP-glucose 4-epimerase